MTDKRNGLRLSVLDQSPVPAGSTPGQALQNSIELAHLVDGLGYSRFWVAELGADYGLTDEHGRSHPIPD